MCGIAGIVRWDGEPIETAEIERMRATMAHRGPDGVGSLVREHVALGHSRLAIIDPAGGHQPMLNEDRTVAVVFNGVIYNYKELRNELTGLGHVFGTASDTEVIVHAWEEWSDEAVLRFRGMFAFAIADFRRRVLFLARDHFGIKPLVYAQEAGQFLFGSEINAVRATRREADEVDPGAMTEFLSLGYICAPRSIYKGIRKLTQAHTLTVHFDGRVEHPKRFWFLRPEPQPERSGDDWAVEVEAGVRESVSAHLVSDVPVGAFLSGGSDSALVVSEMAQAMDRPVSTFSIGFGEASRNELPYARIVARRWQTAHHELVVGAEAFQSAAEVIRRFGEPFADWSAILLYHLARLSRSEVTVCLSGDGGDELFAGYGSYGDWLDRAGQPANGMERSLDTWRKTMIRIMPPASARALLREELRRDADDEAGVFRAAFEESAGFPLVEQAMHLDRQTYLPSGLLMKADIATMMCGLEARTPLLDVRVAELAARTPSEYKLRPDAKGGWRSKWILREILSKYFPASFVDRPKQGFVPPVREWLRTDKAFRQEIEGRLTAKNAHIFEYLDPNAVDALVGSIDTMEWVEPIWSLYSLETWLDGAGQGG